MDQSSPRIRWFEELGLDDTAEVGGKNASLGELYRVLSGAGVKVPNGFATTAAAYRQMLDEAGAWDELADALDGLDAEDTRALAASARQCRDVVYNAAPGAALEREMVGAYRRLEKQYGAGVSVAVRSSATAEDLPGASFAGQHETYLNVSGSGAVVEACRRCLASLFTDRAIRYRIDKGFEHLKVLQSVGVMKMVRSDRAASGVMFTLDTESGFRDVVFINSSYGLGKNVVQGAVDPDELYVHKPTFEAGFRTVLRRTLGQKKIWMVYARGRSSSTTHNVPTPESMRARFSITDAEVLELAGLGIHIERHYSERNGALTPMDIEWAKDGLDGELYILQARPETVASRREPHQLTEYRLTGTGEALASGRAVGNKIAAGLARVVHHADELADFAAGEVLIANITTPDWGTVMRRAGAIVTNRGGRTCHAAIVARELGIPAIVGAQNATESITTGEQVTVSCAEGTTGRVYSGLIGFEKTHVDLGALPRPRTEVMVNVGNPEQAFEIAIIPNDGVGLARIEFVITEYVRAHPMALLHPERVRDAGVRAGIDSISVTPDRLIDTTKLVANVERESDREPALA